MMATGGQDLFLERLAQAEARDNDSHRAAAGERRTCLNDGGFMAQRSTKVAAPPGGAPFSDCFPFRAASWLRQSGRILRADREVSSSAPGLGQMDFERGEIMAPPYPKSEGVTGRLRNLID